MAGIATVGGAAGCPPLDCNAGPDVNPRFVVGALIDGVDPALGQLGLVYAQAGAAHAFGTLCVSSSTSNPMVMTAAPNTANLGQPLYVARTDFTGAANSYGWFQFLGLTPVSSLNSVAAGAGIGIAGAGQAGTLAAGKQILNAYVVAPSTGTVVKNNCSTQNGGTQLLVPNNEGIWIGQAVSGTGIAGSTKVKSILGQNTVVLDTAMNATGVSSVTFTYTGFNLVRLNYPFAQGAIT